MFKAISVSVAGLIQTAVAYGDAFRTFHQVCQENGYAVEHYTLKTSDDYLVSLYRIPGKLEDSSSNNKNKKQKPAVLMLHSQDWDMTQWVTNEPEKANAFILSNAGYDVWMGNNRGSQYSLGHVSLTTDDQEFWNFYQLEMGTIDVPTFIDFVLEKTELDQLSYVGHSEGTTQMFMGTSLMPDYFKEKVNVFVALAPPVFLKNKNVPVAKYWKEIQYVLKNVAHWYDFVYIGKTNEILLASFCTVFKGICDKYLVERELIPEVDNMDRSIEMLANFPSGSTYRATMFYAQCVASDGLFRKYDFGMIENMKLYGQKEPPTIPIEDINIPVAIWNGTRDTAVLPADIDILVEALGDNCVSRKEIDGDHWTFSMAKDMSWFQNDVVDILQQYNPTTDVQVSDQILQ